MMTAGESAEYRKRAAERKKQSRTALKQNADTLNTSTTSIEPSTPGSLPSTPLSIHNPYNTKQSFGKAIARCRQSIPTSPCRRQAVILGLASDIGTNIEGTLERNMKECKVLLMRLRNVSRTSSSDQILHIQCLG